ncbi:MAG: hypothetical protein EOP11_22915 [Proteobacteria bacterium]|nr:MAG: hypothetical protein EOP11_22915 [Pseudomonadota bacterium]
MRTFALLAVILFSGLWPVAALWAFELNPKEVSAAVENGELVVRRLSDGQEVERLKVSKVSKGDRFFHWTEAKNQSRWVAQGYLDRGEMDFLSTPSGTKQVYGPGFYVSTDPLDSKSYGPKGVYADAPQDFYLLEASLRNVPDAAMKGTHEVLKSAGVMGNRATDTWRVFFDEYAVSSLKPTDANAIMDTLYRSNTALDSRRLEALLEISPLKPHPLLAKHFPAVQKTLLGAALNPEEETQLYDQLFNGGKNRLREELIPYLPAEKVQRYRLTKALDAKNEIQALITLDQDLGGLQFDPRIREASPAFADILEGKELSPAARKKLWSDLTRGNLITQLNAKVETPALRRLSEEFRPELQEFFREAKTRGELADSALVAKARQ